MHFSIRTVFQSKRVQNIFNIVAILIHSAWRINSAGDIYKDLHSAHLVRVNIPFITNIDAGRPTNIFYLFLNKEVFLWRHRLKKNIIKIFFISYFFSCNILSFYALKKVMDTRHGSVWFTINGLHIR